jgi:hypothetical protein
MFTEAGIRAWVMGGLNISVRDTVECIDVEGDSCLGNGGIKNIIKDIV